MAVSCARDRRPSGSRRRICCPAERDWSSQEGPCFMQSITRTSVFAKAVIIRAIRCQNKEFQPLVDYR
jgi:hypothetical protein